MKNKIIGCVTSIVIIVLLCSGALADVVKFFCWLFLLQYASPETSIVGGIIVRILTFLVSYGLVGVIFNAIGLFNSKIMKVFYFIISTLVGFALAYMVWLIETYILIIGIIMGILLLGAIIYFVVSYLLNRKKKLKS